MNRKSRLAMLCSFSMLVALLSGAAFAQESKSSGKANKEFFISEFSGSGKPSWRPESKLDVKSLKRPMVTIEVTNFPDQAEPTAEQQRAADELVRRTLEAAKEHGWFEFEQAGKDGFQLMHADPIHHGQMDYILDDRVLDPEKPEFLLYYDTAKGKKLAAVMYLVSTPEERGPQIGGSLTVWHYHAWQRSKCLLNRMVVVTEPSDDGSCMVGEASFRSPEMIHVWFLDHPLGPFSTKMSLPPELLKQLEDREF
jgi:hypothetical protein